MMPAPSPRLRAVAWTLPLALVIAGCATAKSSTATGGKAASPRPGDLVIASPSASQGWDGDKCVSDLQTNGMVYDSLLRIKTPAGDGVAPGLAKSFSYDATKHTYTFEMRPDAKFSSGAPVTAADVVWSIDQWRKGPVSGSYYATIKSERAVSTSVLEVQMKQPDTFLPNLLTWCTSTIYPKDYAGQTAAAFFKKPIGAGAFEVASFTDPTGPSEVIALVPNPHFYGWPGGKPTLKTVTVKTVTDPSQRAVQFKSGNIDIIQGVDFATEQAIGKRAVVRAVPDTIASILVNIKRGPLRDPNLREAISKAIDRKAMASALSDGSEPATGMLPTNVPGATPPTTPYSYDLAGAKAALAKSSSAGGVTLTYLYDASDKALDTSAQILVAQLAKINVRVKLVTTDGNTVTSRESTGDFELGTSTASAISPTIFDPVSYIQAAPYPYAGASMTVIDKAFLTGTAATDPSAQQAQARAIQDDGLRQNVLIGMYNSTASWALQSWVKGFTPLQYGFFYADPVSVG